MHLCQVLQYISREIISCVNVEIVICNLNLNETLEETEK